MTREQLEARGLVLAEMVQQEATIAVLRTQNAELVAALLEARNLIRNLGGQYGELFARIDAALATAGQPQGSGE